MNTTTKTSDKTAFGFLVNDVTRMLRKIFDRRAVRFGCYRLMRSTAPHLLSFTVIVNLISHWMTS